MLSNLIKRTLSKFISFVNVKKVDLTQVPAGTHFNTNENDKLYLSFNENLNFIQIAGPAKDVQFVREYEGKFYYWITFIDGYNFGNNLIDVNAQFRSPTISNLNILNGEVITCPCSAESGGGAEIVVGDCNPELARIEFGEKYSIAGWEGDLVCDDRRRGKLNFCKRKISLP